ncbi:vWA domain-containing protein [Cysteiniphilum halobium]|uniref:vWA domain-containing protein n=1 Tax=Cysteiniphilum halobium TaxID=2219059 RepID=UPI003F825194
MITIAYPWVFVLLLLPIVFRFALPKVKNSDAKEGLRIPFYAALQKTMSQDTTKHTKHLSWFKYLLLVIWFLLVISGTGVQWLGAPLTLPQTGRDLMLAVDLSGSMRTPDMLVNGKTESRIELVKTVANAFIQKREGDRLGLILFGSKPYLQTPLTFDRKTVGQMLNDATVGIAGIQTAIGDAIGLAIKQLMHYPKQSRALILLTDGGNNAGVIDPNTAAKLAKDEHIKIYTIGLGAKQMTIQTMFGPQIVNPSSDLDINGLKKIAQMTGGKFFRAEDGKELQAIYNTINQLEPVKSDKITIRPVTPFYPWTLGVAMILSLILALLWIKAGQRRVV